MSIIVPTGIKAIAYKTGKMAMRKSPQILLAASVTTSIAGTVVACKQTLKLNDKISPYVTTLDSLDAIAEAEGRKTDKKMVMQQYRGIAKECVKLYAIPAALMFTSIATGVTSYAVLNSRYVGAKTFAASLVTAYGTYRSRVVDRFGAQVDQELMLGKPVEVIDPETGEVKKTYPNKIIVASNLMFHFDETNVNFVNNTEMNKTFLLQIQGMVNDRLNAVGEVYADEVIDALGFNKCDYPDEYKECRNVGWSKKDGDVIDFGLDRMDDETVAFRNGESKTVWVDISGAHPL